MPSAFLGPRRLKGWAIVVFLLSLIPAPRDTVAAWTVVVRDTTGRGMEGIDVGQSWYDYTFGLDGVRSNRTDANGQVVFPRVRTYLPVGLFVLMATPSFINVHRGFGTSGSNECRWPTSFPTCKDLSTYRDVYAGWHSENSRRTSGLWQGWLCRT